MIKTLVYIVLVLGIYLDSVNSLELKYKVCTAEELRNYVELVCMRMGRSSNTLLSLSPYGTIDVLDGSVAMLDILKASHQSARNRKRSQDSPSINTCCQETCSIKPEDLVPHCTSI